MQQWQKWTEFHDSAFGGYRPEYADYEPNKLRKTFHLWCLLRTWEIIAGRNPDQSIPVLVLPKECNVFDFHSGAVIRWRRDKKSPAARQPTSADDTFHSPLRRSEPYSSFQSHLSLFVRCGGWYADPVTTYHRPLFSPGTNCFLAPRPPRFSGPSAVPRQRARMAACHIPNIFRRLQPMSGKTVSRSAVSP